MLIKIFNRFNPFYFPEHTWKEKKTIFLNHFKGYQCLDFHYWEPQDRFLLDGGQNNSKRIMMVGITIFYLRLELFIEWNHTGQCWD